MKRQLSNVPNSRHARIILLSTGGVCNHEIALRLEVTPAWVRRIIHRWNKGGLDRRIRRLYAAQPAGGVRLSLDEFGPLNLQPRHGRHWAHTKHGDRLRATYHRTGGVRHFFGVYDLEQDTLRGRFAKRKNARKFLSFLKWVRSQYSPRLTLHVVLDNATYHETAEVLAFARTHRILFYWTPTGASWLNRIECHFTALEKFTLDNTDYRSHPEMQAAIRSYLRWRNRRRRIALPQKHSKPVRLRHAA